jgi:predicted small lipoprotein YifL
MRHLAILGFFLALAGCGPLQMPMAARPTDEGQKKLDACWDKAFADLDQINHQQLLDIYVGTNAYQLGVDKLHLRSEKRTAGGLVVMEINYDRANAAEDRFEVSAFNQNGKLIRHERYDRKEVEQTRTDLFASKWQDKADNDPPEVIEQRAKITARWEKVATYFPKEAEDVVKPKDEVKK